MDLASRSFPVPLSPVISMVELLEATCLARFLTSSMARLLPNMFSNDAVS